MPALPIVKHPVNVYGHLYNECDTAKWEDRLNLLHGELFFLNPGTELFSVFLGCHFGPFSQTVERKTLSTSWHVTISQWNMMVKSALKSSLPSILWHVLAFCRVLWCARYWVIQANIYQSCLQRARMWRRELDICIEGSKSMQEGGIHSYLLLEKISSLLCDIWLEECHNMSSWPRSGEPTQRLWRKKTESCL